MDNTFLSAEIQQQLLLLARDSIESVFSHKPLPQPNNLPAVLNEKRGVFVTLKENGQLRGCIGCIEGIAPLWQTVSEMAQAAAFSDPRFEPLTSDELGKIQIEVSVLTPSQPVHDIGEIQEKKHGVIVQQGSHKGVFLPQVWGETGWDKAEFLSNLCFHKAGISKDAWKTGEVQLFVFEAQVSREKAT